MTAPLLSVVIPTRNGRELLASCLPPLLVELSGMERTEVIVVDDHSSDGTSGWLAEQFPSVKLIAPEGRGFAAACNAGARAAAGEVIAFLNNDAEVQPGWSGALLGLLDRSPDTVIAGGLALFRDTPELVNSGGVRMTAGVAASDIGFGQPRTALQLRERDLIGVTGVSMAVRADWFRTTNGFDELLFMYFEDVELCLRAWLEGYRVRFTPDAVVLHRGSASSGNRYGALRNYYGSRNRVLVAASCLAPRGLLRAVPAFITQDLATVVWVALTGRPRLALISARQRLQGTRAGLAEISRVYQRRHGGPAQPRSFDELRSLGLITPWGSSMLEFIRVRLLELRRGSRCY